MKHSKHSHDLRLALGALAFGAMTLYGAYLWVVFNGWRVVNGTGQ